MLRTDIWKGFFVLLLLLVVVVDGSQRLRRANSTSSNSTDFDILMFSQHWPQTVCYIWKGKSEENECDMPAGEEWLIHGIWPTRYNEMAPFYCNNSTRFNISDIQPLIEEMDVKWLDVMKGKPVHEFWTIEWEKHGTCSAVLESLNSEYKYFKEGLTLFENYDMKEVLARASILPGHAYNVTTILDGVKKILGKNVQVMCFDNSETKEPILVEVRICFNEEIKLVDCDGIYAFPTNCPYNKDVIYPSSVPSHF